MKKLFRKTIAILLLLLNRFDRFGITDHTWAILFQTPSQHADQFLRGGRSQHSHARNRYCHGKIEKTVMGLTVFTSDTASVQKKYHRKMLHTYIMDHLVIAPLEKAGVNRDIRSHTA